MSEATAQTRLVLSVTGKDRPGLTAALAEAIARAGGNWEEGHLHRLGGLWVGAVLVGIASEKVDELDRAVRALDAGTLQVVANPAQDGAPSRAPALLFELIGQDRPGIIREVSRVLAGLGANIESLSSAEETGAWGGERLFRAEIEAHLPDGISPEDAQAALEDISGEIMVDFAFAGSH